MIARHTKNTIALFIALLFHVSGIIGILFTPYKNWFIQNTAFNLLLMNALLFWTQPKKNKSFFYFFLLCFITGFFAEVIGVHTGSLFGNYVYTNVLGIKLFGVPLLIGINWFMIIFCAAIITTKTNEYFLRKMPEGTVISASLRSIAFIIDAALLTTFFDWVMEPVAIKLGFWQWLPNGNIPLYNYLCWFCISAILFASSRYFSFKRHNQFAVHLFIIQLLFFLILRTFLCSGFYI